MKMKFCLVKLFDWSLMFSDEHKILFIWGNEAFSLSSVAFGFHIKNPIKLFKLKKNRLKYLEILNTLTTISFNVFSN